MTNTITLKGVRTFTIPGTPNFIRVDDKYGPIADFSDEELLAVAEAWTKKLLKKAQDSRAAQKLSRSKK